MIPSLPVRPSWAIPIDSDLIDDDTIVWWSGRISVAGHEVRIGRTDELHADGTWRAPPTTASTSTVFSTHPRRSARSRPN